MQLKILIIIVIILTSYMVLASVNAQSTKSGFIKSIDTMKASRDLAREKENDLSFNEQIEQQVKRIAATGATHVAIGTPYDEEFTPYMERWVAAARRDRLKVWFRGNFSGWEQWFGYTAMDRRTHTRQIEAFILKNRHLFQDGDMFSSCPECENGGPGDPRMNGDVTGHRQFLINEYQITKKAFKTIKKNVASNYYSMNGDVALLVMDKSTTKALDGIVTVDHYVVSPDKLAEDILVIARSSGGKVMLGETGIPVLDIHGEISEKESAEWMAVALGKFRTMPELVGINYWVDVGGSTGLWKDSGEPKEIASVIKNFYTDNKIAITLRGENNKRLYAGTINTLDTAIHPDNSGTFFVPYLYTGQKLEVSATGYASVIKVLTKDYDTFSISLTNATPTSTPWWTPLLTFLKGLFNK